jgi:hypothetical protein
VPTQINRGKEMLLARSYASANAVSGPRTGSWWDGLFSPANATRSASVYSVSG